MNESKRGGKREGAGRKSTGEKKIPVTLYIENKVIWKHGSKEAFRQNVYSWVSGAQAAIQDLTKPNLEIKPPEQPKTNYQVNTQPIVTQPLMTKFVAFKERILKTATVPEVEAVMKEVKGELFLTVGEKKTLEAIAKEHSKSMYND